MKRLAALLFVTALGVQLAGCASSGVTSSAGLAAGRSTTMLAYGPVPQDPNPRGGFQSAESPRTYDGARDGIPTPEPAVPQPEHHLAGPTPQIPIPVGRMGIARD